MDIFKPSRSIIVWVVSLVVCLVCVIEVQSDPISTFTMPSFPTDFSTKTPSPSISQTQTPTKSISRSQTPTPSISRSFTATQALYSNVNSPSATNSLPSYQSPTATESPSPSQKSHDNGNNNDDGNGDNNHNNNWIIILCVLSLVGVFFTLIFTTVYCVYKHSKVSLFYSEYLNKVTHNITPLLIEGHWISNNPELRIRVEEFS